MQGCVLTVIRSELLLYYTTVSSLNKITWLIYVPSFQSHMNLQLCFINDSESEEEAEDAANVQEVRHDVRLELHDYGKKG